MKHTPQRCLKIAIKNRSCKCQSVVEFYIHESSQNEKKWEPEGNTKIQLDCKEVYVNR